MIFFKRICPCAAAMHQVNLEFYNLIDDQDDGEWVEEMEELECWLVWKFYDQSTS